MRFKLKAFSILSFLVCAKSIAQTNLYPNNLGIVCDVNFNLPISSYPNDDGNKSIEASILLDSRGNSLSKSNNFEFDENDRLIVYVLGKSDYLKALEVKRTSPGRDKTAIRYIGDTFVENDASKRRDANYTDCYRKFILDDFAPGEGAINLNASSNKSQVSSVIGETTIQVNPLYRGRFSLGIVNTRLTDKNYIIQNNGTDDIIVDSNSYNSDYQFGLMYTPFVWGKRDIRKPTRWWKKFNPTIGIPLENMEDNLYLGINYELSPSISIIVGRHHGKVDRLIPESGLNIGDVFSGAIPTAKQWDDKQFVSISFNMEVLNKLFSFR